MFAKIIMKRGLLRNFFAQLHLFLTMPPPDVSWHLKAAPVTYLKILNYLIWQFSLYSPDAELALTVNPLSSDLFCPCLHLRCSCTVLVVKEG